MDLKSIKIEYYRDELNRNDLALDPVVQLEKWMNDVQKLDISYPNAATLATTSPDGFPQARTILIKEMDSDGLSFFTDYRSQKGIDIQHNPYVSLLLFWKEIDRQVRIHGMATKMDEVASEKYFQSRSRESQLSAWSSHQSSITSKKKLYSQLDTITQNFKESTTLPRPKYWGGYKVSYSSFEFWQGRPNRLHDRFCYRKKNQSWEISRLNP